MGGEYQDMTVKCKKNELEEKFNEIVKQCEWDFGHAGYTGTFAEKDGVKVIEGNWTEDGARTDCEDNNDKWGPAFAYFIAKDTWYIGGWCSS